MGSAATPLGNMVIKLSLDDADFGKGVTNSKKQVKYLVKEMQANMKIADLAGNQLGKLGTRYDGLTKIIGAQEKQVASLKKAYDESFVDGKATNSTKRLATELQNANGKLAGYKQQLINTAGQMAELQVKTTGVTGKIAESSEKMVQYGDRMQSMGSTLTKGLTGPIAGLATVVTKAAIDWESSFAGVKKTNDEIIDSNGNVIYSYSDLEKGLRNLANELPATHKEIASVAEAAGQLGIQTDNVVDFTKVMIDLGESTNMSAETAATELARFANITQMSQGKFRNLGSALVDLGNNFATTESEISTMALRLAGAGKQIGMSEGDILGFAAALSSVGIEAEAGGSAFSKVMINMQLATEKGVGAFDELKKHAEDQGVSWEQLVSAIHNGGSELTDVSKEMGLTSSELKKMYKEADNSKTSLEQFADVAGMTGEQFTKMFKENPAEAVMKFVEGLGKAEEKGISAIKVLDDMDITEVRLRDSLLRAANANDVFSDAIKVGNKAFEENTALTNEASKRYETTESKLEMLRNEAKNAAIDLGGPFVDALRDGLESAKPLIKGLGDLAKKFSDMDPKTQRTIIKWIGLTAAAGPLLSITGKITSGIGKLGGSFIDLSAKFAKKKAIEQTTKLLAEGAISTTDFTSTLASGTEIVKKFGKTAMDKKDVISGLATSITEVGTAATTAVGTGTAGAATSGIAGLGASVASLASPIAIGIGALAAIAGAVYVGKKAYDEHQLAGAKWATAVTEEQDKVISNSYELRDKAVSYVNEYSDGVAGAADKAIKANQDIVESIKKTIEEEKERKKAAAEKLDDPESKAKAEKTIAYDDMVNKVLVEQAQKRVNRINKILEDASKHNRDLTTQERQFIEDNYKQLSSKQLEQLGFSKEQRIAIEAAYQNDLSKLSKKQINERAKHVKEALDTEQKHYEEQKESIGKIYGENTQAYKVEMDKLNKSHKKTTESMILGFAKLRLEQGYSLADSAAYWNEYGWTVDEVTKLVNSSMDTTTKNLDMLAKGTEEADIQWNSLALDPKTGEVRTNMADTLAEIAKADDGWQQLKFMIKNADISTNAKEEVAIAMGQAGKWNELYLTDKELLVDGDEAKLQLYDSIEKLGIWNQYNADRKLLGIDNADAIYKLLESKDAWKDWDKMPDSEKKMFINNEDLLGKILESDNSLKAWKELPNPIKYMLGNNEDLSAKVKDGTIDITKYNESVLPEIKRFFGNNEDLLNKVLTSEDLWIRWIEVPDSEKKMLLDNQDLLNKIFASEESLNSWNELPDSVKYMLANNEDILSKVQDGTISVEDYNRNVLPALKKLFGDNSDVIQKLLQGESELNTYNGNNPAKKILNGDSSSTQQAAKSGGSALNIFDNNNPEMKYLKATDNASRPAYDATEGVKAFSRQNDHTVTLTSIFRNVTQWITEKFTRDEKGTNYHPGGLALVNDQKGPLYKEIVQLPNGRAFIPQERNVMLNLPIGSKVIKASETKAIMERFGVPKYAKGIGVPKDATLIRNLQSVSNSESSKNITIDNSDLVTLMRQMLNAISRLTPQINVYPQNWETKADIRRTAQELALLTEIERRGTME